MASVSIGSMLKAKIGCDFLETLAENMGMIQVIFLSSLSSCVLSGLHFLVTF